MIVLKAMQKSFVLRSSVKEVKEEEALAKKQKEIELNDKEKRQPSNE